MMPLCKLKFNTYTLFTLKFMFIDFALQLENYPMTEGEAREI